MNSIETPTDKVRTVSQHYRDCLSHGQTFFLLASFAVVTFLVYANSLTGAFVLDDIPNILENPHIRITELSPESIKDVLNEGFLRTRPIASLSFALNYYFGGYDLAGYHVVNICIHFLTAIFLYLFLVTTLSLPAVRLERLQVRWVSYATVLIWLVHPLHVQSVTYIVQRMNSMYAMFYILAMLFYARGRLAGTGKAWLFFAGCMMSFLLALGSKENAITLPVFILIYEWYFFQDLSRPWLRRALLPAVGILFFLLAAVYFYMGPEPWQKIQDVYLVRDFTLVERVLTQFRVVFFYLSLLFFPHPSRLNLDHDFLLSSSLFEPLTTFFAAAALVILFVVSIRFAKRYRLLSFCVLWYFGNLVVESSVIGLEIIFEHRTYLPSMMVILCMVILLFRLIRSKSIQMGIVMAICIMLSLGTYKRNIIWQSPMSLWADVLKKSPAKPRGYNEVGMLYYKNQEAEKAVPYFLASIQLKPEQAKPHGNLGLYYLGLNRIDLAIEELKLAIQYGPAEGMYHINLGIAYMQKGMFVESRQEIALGKEIRKKQKNTDAFIKPH